MPLFTVLGAAGFIGSELVRHLRGQGHEVFAPRRGDPANYRRDLGRVIYAIGVSDDYADRPLDTADAHVGLLIRLLRDARFERLVYLSSVRLYDGLAGIGDESRVLHLDPQRKRHLYDLSKALGEALCHHAARPAIVARLGNVYDDALAQEDFLCRTVRQCLARGAVCLEASPVGGRDYIHLGDVAVALEAIALAGREPVYNIATGSLFTNRELAEALRREIGGEVSFGAGANSASPPVVSIVRLIGEFGLRPSPMAQRLPEILRRLKRAGATR